jgi:hypothetical protein
VADCRRIALEGSGDEDVLKTKAGIPAVPLGEGVLVELKAWRERTKFKASDDLLFPNRYGKFYGYRAMVKLKFAPWFVELQKKWASERRDEPLEAFTWHACGTLRFHAGSMLACPQDCPDLCGPFQPAGDNGQVRTSFPIRPAQSGHGRDCQQA